MPEPERAPKVRVGLIGRANEEQEEQPAPVSAGQIDRDHEDEDVDTKKHGAQAGPPHAIEEGVQRGPGDLNQMEVPFALLVRLASIEVWKRTGGRQPTCRLS